MEKSKISYREKIHFIGIGGIGMSGLAEVMKDMGFNVQGSDVTNSKNVERCKKMELKSLSNTTKKILKIQVSLLDLQQLAIRIPK